MQINIKHATFPVRKEWKISRQLLIVVFLIAATFSVHATEITLNPIRDAYVRGGDYADNNFGSDELLEVKQGSNHSFFRKSYVMFDLTGIHNVQNAVVRLFASSVQGFEVTVYETTNDWSEGSITWNNAPFEGRAIVSTHVTSGNQYYEWDVTAFVANQISGDGVVSLVFYDAAATNGHIKFNSREAGSNVPELVITGEMIPAKPADPSDLAAAVISETQIKLSWTDNSGNEDGFLIERSTDDEGEFFEITNVGANVTSFMDEGLNAATTYTYRVSAYNTVGYSGYTNVVSKNTQRGDGVVYYVDALSGDDANDGITPETAWKTLAKVSSITFQPGEAIHFKAGGVWNEAVSFNGSGTEGKPIVVDMYGIGNKPIFNGGGGSGSVPTVLLENVEYWEINNLEITNSDGSSGYQSDLWGIRVYANVAGEFKHIYIRDCYIHKINGDVETKDTGGIYVTVESPSDSPAWYSDVQIQNNVIGGQPGGDLVGGLGIATQSTHGHLNLGADRKPFLNVLISGNVVGPTGRNGIIIRVSDDAVVEHNRVQFSSRINHGHSIFNFNTDGVKVQYNEAYGNTGSPSEIDRGGFDADFQNRNSYFQYNYSHRNNWFFGIMKRGVQENVVCRYNISENDRYGIYYFGFNTHTDLTDAHIYNNTHYFSAHLDVNIIATPKPGDPLNTIFANNIFYFEGTGSWGNFEAVNTTYENNCFYNVEPRGTNYILADPQFVNPGSGEYNIDWSEYPNVLTGYRLQPTSPCIGAGKVMANNGGQDFWGNPLYSGNPDIGAHEFTGTETSITGLSDTGTAFGLLGNHPNPFYQQTTIRFEIKEVAHVQLLIYDMHGRLIKSLIPVNKYAKGSHDVVWDGSDNSGQKAKSGIYTYQIIAEALETGEVFKSSHKMLMH